MVGEAKRTLNARKQQQQQQLQLRKVGTSNVQRKRELETSVDKQCSPAPSLAQATQADDVPDNDLEPVASRKQTVANLNLDIDSTHGATELADSGLPRKKLATNAAAAADAPPRASAAGFRPAPRKVLASSTATAGAAVPSRPSTAGCQGAPRVEGKTKVVNKQTHGSALDFETALAGMDEAALLEAAKTYGISIDDVSGRPKSKRIDLLQRLVLTRHRTAMRNTPGVDHDDGHRRQRDGGATSPLAEMATFECGGSKQHRRSRRSPAAPPATNKSVSRRKAKTQNGESALSSATGLSEAEELAALRLLSSELLTLPPPLE